ncbi:MAG: C39 family peptidase [Lachnospiraceae bacterium]|nr:C39 family peptidase [Lachnospiraceae bacterium]
MKKALLASIILLLAAVMSSCRKDEVQEESAAAADEADCTDMINGLEELTEAGPDADIVEEILSSDLLLSSAVIDGIPEIRQYPELPNGCESVSLTIVLRSRGFILSKTAIANNWLNRHDNMAMGYPGDPSDETGLSVFTTGLKVTAENFLESMGSDLKCYDLDGTSFDDLLKFVQAGHPVIVWTTTGMAEPEFTGKYYKYSGKKIEWYTNEHCVVLYGYDLDEGTVLISDPLDGLVKRDLDKFRTIYDTVGRIAMVII